MTNNIDIRFSGSANLRGVESSVANLRKQIQLLNASANEVGAAIATGGMSQAQIVKQYRAQENYTKQVRANFEDGIKATKQFRVEQMAVETQSSKLSRAIDKQKLSFKDLIKERQSMSSVIREQMRLEQMQIVQWGRANGGKMSVTSIVPEQLSKDLNKNKIAWGVWNQAVQSASHQLVNWGKNTQWAGRQMTVGLTMPLVLGAAAVGKLAYEVDKGMTRIGKVYDYAATSGRALTQETETLNQNILNMATSLSQNYGMALRDVLSMTEKFAATGLRGNELLGTTKETARGAFLGDLSEDNAVELSTTLKTVWKVTNEELKQAYDYMNAIENSTSLSMQDFTEGIPKVAGIVQSLGGDLKDAGALLVAMKAQGIDAAEGATAIKSGLFKAVAADAKSIELFDKLTGQSYDKLRQMNIDQRTGQVDFVSFLRDVGGAIQAINPAQQVEIAKKLFGIHQGSKLLGILNQMADSGGQFAQAMETGQKSMIDLANIADQETAKLQASTSGRIKILIESIKTQFAIAGEALLEPLIPVLGVIEKLLMWFNSLGDGSKKFLAIGAVITALIGPAVMFVGIMANMVGTTIGLISKLLTLGSTFKMASAEERAAALIAREAAIGFNTEAVAAQALKTQLDALTGSIKQMTAANMMASGGIGATPVTGKHSAPYNPTLDLAAGSADPKRAKGMDDAANASSKIEASSEATAGFWGKIGLAALSVGGVVGGFSVMQDSSASMLENITGISIALLSLAPILSAFRGFNPLKAMSADNIKSKFAGIGESIKESMGGATASVTKGVDANTSRMGKSMGVMKNIAGVAMRTFGPVGILAGGALVAYKIWSHLRKIKEEQQQINQSAKTWSEIIGFSYQQQSAMGTDSQTSIIDKRVEELQKKNEALFKLIQSNRSDDAIAKLAVSEGLKAAEAGANATEALQVAQTVIYAGVQDAIKRSQLMQRVTVAVDWQSPTSVITKAADDQVAVYVDAVNKALERSKIESFWDNISGSDASGKSEEQAKGVAQRFVASFFRETDVQKRKQIYNQQLEALLVPSSGLLQEMKAKYGDAVKNITALEGLLPDPVSGVAFDIRGEDLDKIRAQIELEKQLTQEIARGLGVNKDEIEQLTTINALRDYMYRNGKDQGLAGLVSITEAQRSYAAQLNESAHNGSKLTDQQKLEILNHYRAAAGLNEATKLSDQFGNVASDAQKKATNATKQTTSAIGELTAAQREAAENAYLGAISNTYDAAFSYADDQFQANADAAMDKVQARGEQRLDAFDKRSEAQADAIERRADAAQEEAERKKKLFDRAWDKRMDDEEAKWDRRKDAENKIYDNRIARVDAQIAAEERAITVQQKAIEAEQRAEEIRQKIFQAEQTRIERLAQLANDRIDFNMALNSGNLDEAAKLFTSMGATQESWATEDASDSSKTNSEKSIAGREAKIEAAEARQKTLEAEKDAIEKARDARLKALEATEKAEKAALEARKLRESDSLQATIDANKKRIENEKKAVDERNKMNREFIVQRNKREQDAAEKEWKIRKAAMDMELAILKAAIPQNENQLNDHIRRVATAYDKYGVNLTGKGSQWGAYIKSVLSTNIASAAASINGLNWGGFGASVGDQIAKGAFGMSLAEFNKWISTGELPSGGLKAQGTAKRTPSEQRALDTGHVPATFHKGTAFASPMGGSGRVGYSANQGLAPSEFMARLKVGERVVDKDKNRQYGPLYDAIENGQLNKFGGTGGAFDAAVKPVGTAIAGMMGMAMSAMMRGTMNSSMQSAAQVAQGLVQGEGVVGDVGVGQAGMYGGRKLSAEQLANAKTIMQVGKSLGASQRDLIISLMTAMQESQLRNLNYGDRDSVGLFQQRNAWGSFADRTNPAKSARMFFLGGQAGQRGLFDFKNRNSMSLTQAAQAVQVSAFPNAYAKWQSMAEAIVNGATFTPGKTPGPIVAGGWTKPIRSGYRVGMRYGGYPGHTGQDFPASVGTPVYSAASGRVVTSTDLRNANGGYRSYGRYIVVQHANGVQTAYAHNSARLVNAGQNVAAGQQIARVGSTGNSTGPHLHFETRRNGKAVEPLAFLRAMGVPSMKVGGDLMHDTLINAHKGERVLTKPLTEKLDKGIDKIANGAAGMVQLMGDVNVILPDSVSGMDIPRLAKEVKKEFDAAVDKIGRPRKIGG